MKRLIVVFMIISLFTACGGKNDKQDESNSEEKNINKKESKIDLKKELLGKWKNSKIKVTMKTEKGDSVLLATPKTWGEVLNIKPIITTFKKNGTFKSVYKSLDNEIIMTREGEWSVKKDSLFMTQDKITTAYKVKIDDGKATFRGILDWDQDGEVDDLYQGRQIKMAKKDTNKPK